MSELATTQPDVHIRSNVEQDLFERRQKIYPREVHGRFAMLRTTGVIALLGLFYFLPWVSWNGRQAVLFDLPARKFHIFGLTFWPQDFLLLALLMLSGALLLFFVTAIAGRLWCGYACPQTVWTEVFLWLERLVEGTHLQQRKRDNAPWSLAKLRIKATKQVLWLSFSAFTGFTFVSFFTPAHALFNGVITWTLGPWEWFWMIFYGFATYGNAGYLREQVCKYMCPYARFQSAMFDADTLVVSYDTQRGEPRGSRKSGVAPGSGLGDCIDCTMCVQVCPTGIDIRRGLQYECIGCSACIDICNEVMGRMAYAPGLIRYTTQHALEGKPVRVIRARILVYAALLVLVGLIFTALLATRLPLGLDIMRDRNQLYRERAGLIENVYTLKVLNLEDIPQRYELSARGIEGLELIGSDFPIEVPAGAVVDVPVVLRAEEGALPAQSTLVEFRLSVVGQPEIGTTEAAKFLGPRP